MSKRAEQSALRAKIKATIERGGMLSSMLVRLARAQGSLRNVTPQYMVYKNGDFYALPPGVFQCDAGAEIHDMWRDVDSAELMYALVHKTVNGRRVSRVMRADNAFQDGAQREGDDSPEAHWQAAHYAIDNHDGWKHYCTVCQAKEGT